MVLDSLVCKLCSSVHPLWDKLTQAKNQVLKSLSTLQTLKREKTGVIFSQFSPVCSQKMTTPQSNSKSNQFREFKMVLLPPNCTKVETILMNFQRQSNLFLATIHLTYWNIQKLCKLWHIQWLSVKCPKKKKFVCN